MTVYNFATRRCGLRAPAPRRAARPTARRAARPVASAAPRTPQHTYGYTATLSPKAMHHMPCTRISQHHAQELSISGERSRGVDIVWAAVEESRPSTTYALHATRTGMQNCTPRIAKLSGMSRRRAWKLPRTSLVSLINQTQTPLKREQTGGQLVLIDGSGTAEEAVPPSHSHQRVDACPMRGASRALYCP